MLAVAAAVVGANLALEALDDATQDPQGPPSSSYSTSPRGVAAYAELLERYGHPVLQLRDELAEAELDPAATVVVLDPGPLGGDEVSALARFVSSGGRLVASGDSASALGGDLDLAPTGSPLARDRDDALPSVERVRTEGRWAWDGATAEGVSIVLGSPRSPFLLERRDGRGRALLLAESSPLLNALLGEADNAALGLALAGAPPRPVVFVESVHGYGRATGVGAIPSRWWWVLGGLALAGVLYALAVGRRLGPAERDQRDLPPPRAEFADALATSLAKVRPRVGAVETVRRIVRLRLARAARLPHDADDEALRRAAAELRVGEVESVLGRGSDDATLLALGRLLGELERKEAGA